MTRDARPPTGRARSWQAICHEAYRARSRSPGKRAPSRASRPRPISEGAFIARLPAGHPARARSARDPQQSPDRDRADGHDQPIGEQCLQWSRARVRRSAPAPGAPTRGGLSEYNADRNPALTAMARAARTGLAPAGELRRPPDDLLAVTRTCACRRRCSPMSTMPSPRPSMSPKIFPSTISRMCIQQAYALGLKGCTTFRPNPVTGAVLAR